MPERKAGGMVSLATDVAPDDMPDDSRARRNVAVLIAAQAILGAQTSMNFIAGGLAGLSLAPTPLLATLPISLIVFGSMTTAPWISPLMQRRGRRFGFVLGALAGAAGGALAMLGLWLGSFATLLAGAYLTGIYMSTLGFYRFAATDTASDAYRPKAISYVMAGGLLSAIVGPAAREAHGGCDGDPVPLHLRRGDRAQPRRDVAVLPPRHPDARRTGEGCAARADAGRVAALARHPRVGDLRDGQLRADEPGDDLDAARRGRLRLRYRATRRTSSRRMWWRCTGRASSPAT